MTVVRALTRSPCETSRTRSLTKSQALSLLSIARLNSARSRIRASCNRELAVDRQIEQCKITNPRGELQSDAYRPDLLEPERGLLADQLVFVPGIATLRRNFDGVHIGSFL